MGLFSFFGATRDEVEGSYCEPEGRHVDVIKGRKNIDFAIDASEERGDDVDVSGEEFDEKCINVRHDDDGKSVVSGPTKPWWFS
ncbi:MAG: hypothetical protein AB8B99_02970 [Phormidesmis sp.]